MKRNNNNNTKYIVLVSEKEITRRRAQWLVFARNRYRFCNHFLFAIPQYDEMFK